MTKFSFMLKIIKNYNYISLICVKPTFYSALLFLKAALNYWA